VPIAHKEDSRARHGSAAREQDNGSDEGMLHWIRFDYGTATFARAVENSRAVFSSTLVVAFLTRPLRRLLIDACDSWSGPTSGSRTATQ
jgi:hypothetical protein